MLKNTNVALLVHACDRYQLLFKGFESIFSQYWDFSTQCNLYFATEELHVQLNGFQNIRSGKGEWSDRLAYLLKNEIREDYVLYLQEDVWFTKPISAAFFNNLFALVQTHNYRQVKLHSADIYQTKKTDEYLHGFNVSVLDNARSRYLMSHQVTLWNRNFLIDQLPKGENPWRNENRGSKRLKKADPVIHHIDYFSQNHSAPINENLELAERSNFHTVSLNGMFNEEFLHFVNKLPNQSEADDNYVQKLLYHYNHELTHDGRERPRKDDIFKRVKNWILQK
ncbi:hypothetical protein [Dyadobacter sandarakinus]|uniref:Glycosyl transferase family 2 n=1 Tax=Dyadobacter sandarakinus TaxID=2747268 RepID=A0ABX7I664_9BACT|nr:hypothetical protein [Dyadobacter sandarakinus]QRR01591.1 hypothetical protein HWI92_12080 [Dyadobacter sandarakinus]